MLVVLERNCWATQGILMALIAFGALVVELGG